MGADGNECNEEIISDVETNHPPINMRQINIQSYLKIFMNIK